MYTFGSYCATEEINVEKPGPVNVEGKWQQTIYRSISEIKCHCWWYGEGIPTEPTAVSTTIKSSCRRVNWFLCRVHDTTTEPLWPAHVHNYYFYVPPLLPTFTHEVQSITLTYTRHQGLSESNLSPLKCLLLPSLCAGDKRRFRCWNNNRWRVLPGPMPRS